MSVRLNTALLSTVPPRAPAATATIPVSSCRSRDDRGAWARYTVFNLVYSGNHYGAVELSAITTAVRVQTGINPHCFEWTLDQGGRFETPEAVMTFSSGGFNGLSAHFHDFVNNHIVRGEWKDKERPVLINNWEAHFFKFNEGRLMRLARRARRLGIELFVLDDGWFGKPQR